jgi:hypothetical protein
MNINHERKMCPSIDAIKLKNIRNVTVRIIPSAEFLAHVKKRSVKGAGINSRK